MPSDIIIEKAEEQDAAVILELQKLAYMVEAERYDDFSIPPMTERTEALVSDIRENIVLKAVSGSEIIGSVRARADTGTCFIGRLIVHPEYQGMGIGTRLMNEIERMNNDKGRYELYTGHLSKKNIALYKKLGYREFKIRVATKTLTFVYFEKTAE